MSIKIYDVTGELVIDMRARGKWCKLPYGPLKDKNGKIKRDRYGNIKYDHPDGCPSYGKKEGCPPNSKKIYDFINLTQEHWFIVFEFDIEAQERKQKRKHPHWSKKQCRNSRHWQRTVHKHLRIEGNRLCSSHNMVFNLCPEGMGVHVIRSAKNIGIPIKSRPKDYIYKIALVGYLKQSKTILDSYFGIKTPDKKEILDVKNLLELEVA